MSKYITILQSKFTLGDKMKGISEKFDDEEFEFLREKKGDMSWHEFILKSAGYIRKKGLAEKIEKVLGR